MDAAVNILARIPYFFTTFWQNTYIFCFFLIFIKCLIFALPPSPPQWEGGGGGGCWSKYLLVEYKETQVETKKCTDNNLLL